MLKTNVLAPEDGQLEQLHELPHGGQVAAGGGLAPAAREREREMSS